MIELKPPHLTAVPERTMRAVERRAHERVRGNFTLWYESPKGWSRLTAVDISQGGMGLISPQEFQTREVLLRVGVDAQQVVFKAEAVWSTPGTFQGNPVFRYGVRYTEITSDQLEALLKMLDATAPTSAVPLPSTEPQSDGATAIVQKLSSEDAYELMVAPLEISNGRVRIAVLDDTPEYLNDIVAKLEKLTGLQVFGVEVRGRASIVATLEALYPEELRASSISLVDRDGRKLWAFIQEKALRRHCQDFHIEPLPGGGGVVRYVIDNKHDSRLLATPDGRNNTAIRLTQNEYQEVCRVIESAANMVDGPGSRLESITLKHGTDSDGRVLKYELANGPTFSFRVIGNSKFLRPVTSLGMPDDVLEEWKAAVFEPEGVVAVVGRPSSGKNTTMLAGLSLLPLHERNDVSIERPIEIVVDGLKQVPIKDESEALPVLQDLLSGRPTSVYINETKANDTAQALIAAGRNGFKLFTTFHAAGALYGPERLQDFGISLRSSSVVFSTILAQKLLGRLCSCAIEYRLTELCRTKWDQRYPQLIEADAKQQLRGPKPGGCEVCAGTGYRDMVGIFEILRFSDEIKQAFAEGAAPAQVLPLAREQGFRPMVDCAIEHVIAGVTSVREVLTNCVTGFRDDNA